MRAGVLGAGAVRGQLRHTTITDPTHIGEVGIVLSASEDEVIR